MRSVGIFFALMKTLYRPVGITRKNFDSFFRCLPVFLIFEHFRVDRADAEQVNCCKFSSKNFLVNVFFVYFIVEIPVFVKLVLILYKKFCKRRQSQRRND
jgi:hypothetical protein